MRRRARLLAVLGVLAGGALGVIGSTQTWLIATLRDGAELTVPGAAAIPVLTPLSLAVLALGGALALVGRAARWVLSAVAVAIGAVLVWQIAALLADAPVAAVSGTVTEATGISGVAAVGELVAVIDTTPWSTVGLAGAALIVAAGAAALATGHRWHSAGRRYVTEHASRPGDGPLDAVDSWDDLSRGDDPTDGPVAAR